MASDRRAHQYQSVKADERDEVDDLEMHIDDTIDLDEKDYMHMAPPPTRRARVLGVLNRFRWVIDGLLVALLVMLLVDRQWGGGKAPKETQAQYEGAGDVTGFAPRCMSRQNLISMLVCLTLTCGQFPKRL